MNRKASVKIVLFLLGGFLTVTLTMLALIPFLYELLAVEVVEQSAPAVTQAPLPEAPEKVPVTVYYVMPENSKKISAIYIEVFHAGASGVSYMQVPVDTKVNLSEELYKSLQTYAPELPQYLKLSNMAESFSTEYGLTGCNRILSEVLGISLKAYVRTGAESMAEWLKLPGEEKTETGFFEAYKTWMENSSSSRTIEERWSYYESRRCIKKVIVETAPGSQEKDGYLLSGKRSREMLEEWMLRQESETEPQG